MVLVDTSVWVDHLHYKNPQLIKLLNAGDVMCHHFIIGELACGNIKNRKEILSLLKALPITVTASQEKILHFIEVKNLMGKGLGYIDIHLLSSAFLSNVSLWSLDKKLRDMSATLKLEFSQSQSPHVTQKN